MNKDQNFWNFIFTVFFVAVVAGATWTLFYLGRLPIAITTFDLVLVIFATFRLTRLFVYDLITQFIRDWFLDKKTEINEAGEEVIVCIKCESGPRRTISDLLGCPWCIGVWASLMVLFFYYLSPYAWFPILVLAVSGVGTLLQLLANMIGWRAELSKQEAMR